MRGNTEKSCPRHRFLPIAMIGALIIVGASSGCSAELPPASPPAAESSPVSVSTCRWPRFHGPKGDNISADTGLLTAWPEGGPKLLWTAQGIGHGFSNVTIADGRIYTAGNKNEKSVVTALDLAGKILWQAAVGPSWEKDAPGTRGTPTVDGDCLYYESPMGDLVCLEAATGRKRWGLNILERFEAKNLPWALAESVLIDGDRVICCPGGPHAMVALDKHSGAVVWKSPTAAGDLAGYASPALAEQNGLRMILTMTSKAMIGVNADSGELLWRFPHETPWDENILMPLYHDGRIVISTMKTACVMLRVNVKGQQATVEELWRSKDLDSHHGGVILLDGFLYGAAAYVHGAGWVCLDWSTGALKYAERGVGKGSLTCAEGMLYTLSERGTLGLVKATPDGHQVISQFKLPSGGEGAYWAHPVVCGGRLYVRHSDRLFAHDVRE